MTLFTTTKNIKIGYISNSDPYSRRTWSGIPYYAIQSLNKHCGRVEYLGAMGTPLNFLGRICNGLLSPVNLRYNYPHSKLVAKSYARKIEKRLRGKSFDVLLTHCTTDISYISTKIPIVLYTDATLPLLMGYYAYFSKLFKWSINESLNTEYRALRNAAHIIYPSQWAAESAQKDYGIEESKISVVNYGANLDQIPDKETVLKRKRSNSDKCKLLFLGVEWDRKGGPIAFETLLKLNAMGIDAELVVVGCVPPVQFKNQKLTVIPFLNKNNLLDRNKFYELLLQSNFLLLPTRSEAYGIVFCEASAFGLPSIATDTGGVSSVITQGQNGFLFPIHADSNEYAQCIGDIYNNKLQYNRLVSYSRDLYECRLNWDSWGIATKKIIEDVVASRQNGF